MKSKWLHWGKRGDLLVFCNGWGMDEYPFRVLASHQWNVLMFYDYRDLSVDQDLDWLMGEYNNVALLGWSMGVWAGQQMFEGFSERISTAIAINGSLCPIDDHHGIPLERVQATYTSLDEKQRLKFYARMCKDRSLYRQFLMNQPRRKVESQKKELGVLLESAVVRKSRQNSIYDCAVVASHDSIVPTRNQLRFWPEKIVRQVAGSHFLFYSYKSWDEIVETLSSRIDNGFTTR